MKRILVYDLIKGVLAFFSCLLFFTLLPFSVFILLLPIDLIGWWLLKPRMSAATWIGTSFMIYLGVLAFAFTWIMTGHTGLEFLLDFDVVRRKF